MNGLSLCAGAGALDLALEIAFPGYRTIAAVENNPEAAKRFRLRFPEAKLFRDVLGFDARPLHGIVDCVCAGFPCQPHSVAGKRKGTTDDRWLWPDIARIIDETGAPVVALENVSGLLRDTDADSNLSPDRLEDEPGESFGGMGTILRDLAQMGFITLWGSLRAAQVGASHGRPRVFILAYKPGGGFGIDRSAPGKSGYAHECGSGLEHPDRARHAPTRPGLHLDGWAHKATRPMHGSEGMEDAGFDERRRRIGRIEEIARPDGEWRGRPDRAGGNMGIPAGTGLPQRRDDSGLREFPAVERTGNAVGNPEVWDELRRRTSRPEARQQNRRSSDTMGTFAPGPADPLWLDILAENPYLAPALSPVTKFLVDALSQEERDFQAEIESGFRGLVDGMAGWLVERRPRLHIGGNGVVPLQAAAVFRKLAQIAGIEQHLLTDDSARDVTARVPEGAIPGVGCTTRAERF